MSVGGSLEYALFGDTFSACCSLEYAVVGDRYSGKQSNSMAELNFCFQPVSKDENLGKGHWLPFSDFHDGSYDKFMKTYRNFTNNVKRESFGGGG